jgi:hypothetical protein
VLAASCSSASRSRCSTVSLCVPSSTWTASITDSAFVIGLDRGQLAWCSHGSIVWRQAPSLLMHHGCSIIPGAVPRRSMIGYVSGPRLCEDKHRASSPRLADRLSTTFSFCYRRPDLEPPLTSRDHETTMGCLLEFRAPRSSAQGSVDCPDSRTRSSKARANQLRVDKSNSS